MEESIDRSRFSQNNSTCVSVGSQCAQVSLPVNLKPYALLGEIKTECCGEPNISLRTGCSGKYEMIITQTICIKIPIEYGACVRTGGIYVNCNQNTNQHHYTHNEWGSYIGYE